MGTEPTSKIKNLSKGLPLRNQESEIGPTAMDWILATKSKQSAPRKCKAQIVHDRLFWVLTCKFFYKTRNLRQSLFIERVVYKLSLALCKYNSCPPQNCKVLRCYRLFKS